VTAVPFSLLAIGGAVWPHNRVRVTNFEASTESHGTQHRLSGGGAMLQFNGRPGDSPANASPAAISLTLVCQDESDRAEIERMLRRAQPLSIFVGDYITDEWTHADGDSTWRTSRQLPLGLALPALDWIEGWIDGAAATIVTTAPGAGEIQIPSANTGAGAIITTEELLPGTRLELRYAPIRICAAAVSISRSPNSHEIDLELFETVVK
jgi:hypothetical protein